MGKSKAFKFAKAAAMQANNDRNFFDKLKASFRLITAYRQKQYKPDTINLLIGVLVVVYIISPLDFLPGIILDDIGVFLFGLKYFNKEIINFMNWEKSQNRYNDVEEAKLIN